MRITYRWRIQLDRILIQNKFTTRKEKILLEFRSEQLNRETGHGKSPFIIIHAINYNIFSY